EKFPLRARDRRPDSRGHPLPSTCPRVETRFKDLSSNHKLDIWFRPFCVHWRPDRGPLLPSRPRAKLGRMKLSVILGGVAASVLSVSVVLAQTPAAAVTPDHIRFV